MKKRLYAAAAAICCLASSLCTAVDAEYTGNRVTVTEQAQSQANQRFTLRVYKPGADKESGDVSDFAYVAERTADENGKVSFDFTLNSESGFYDYIIRSESGEAEFEGTINFVNEAKYQNILEQLLRAEGAAEVKAIMEENMQELLLVSDFPIYEKIKNLDTASAYARMADLITEDTGSGELGDIFRRSMALCGASKGNSELVRELADGYKAYLGCEDEEINSMYDLLSNDNRMAVAELVAGGSYLETEQVASALATGTVIVSMNCAGSWQELGEIMNKYADAAKLNLSEYKNLTGSKPNSVLQELVTKRPFKSAADFQSKLTAAAKAVNNSNNASTSSGGSSSSGSSKGGISATISAGALNGVNSTTANEIFSDLSTVEWAREAIEELAKLNVVSGREAGKFDPQTPVTREEFVKILVLALGMQPSGGELAFEDATPGAWYYGYVSAAVEYGIAVGISETSFGVGTPITRQDAAVMIVRAANKMGVPLTASEEFAFSDWEYVADYARNAVSTLAANRVVNGIGDGTFAPNKAITRAEAAKIVYGVRGIGQ